MAAEPRPERVMSIDRTLLGSACHLGAGAILRAVIGQPLPDDDFPWRKETSDAVASGVVPDPELLASEIVAGHSDLSSELPGLIDRLGTFYRRFRASGDVTTEERNEFLRQQILFCEHSLAVDGNGKVCSYDSCPQDGWRGRIDYAEDSGDGVLTVIDFKNRPAIFPESELLENEQLSLYVWLVSQHYPQFTSFRVGIYYFQFGNTQLVDITKDQVEANVAKLRARARHKSRLSVQEIAPEPGFGKCQYCDYLSSCDAGAAVLEPSLMVPTDMSSAQDLARWLMVNEERVKSAREAMRAFTAEHGPVVIDDGTVIGYCEKSQEKIDKNAALKILKSLIDSGKLTGRLSQFTALDRSSVSEAVKSNEEVGKALEPAKFRVTKTEFEVFRPNKRQGVRKPAPGERKVRGRVKSAARSGDG